MVAMIFVEVLLEASGPHLAEGAIISLTARFNPRKRIGSILEYFRGEIPVGVGSTRRLEIESLLEEEVLLEFNSRRFRRALRRCQKMTVE
jgi:hypothetical protein